jgi:hypothetical protein
MQLDNLPDDLNPLQPEDADQLYENYRVGFIKRHICLNGRVDENTYLQERGQRWHSDMGPRPRIDLNRRRGMEIWTEYNPETKQRQRQNNPFEKVWWPMYEGSAYRNRLIELGTSKSFDAVIPESIGGGDNPLLSTGLALATFSLEDLMEVSDHSYEYARQLFDFIQVSTIRHSGFFLRSRGFNSPYKKQLFFASTDELLGVCVGLVFYFKTCSIKGRSSEVDRIRTLATSIANRLDRHGCWILPEASVYRSIANTTPHLDFQRGWIFSYVFKQVFRYLCGKEVSREWDPEEYEAYFGTTAALASGLIDLAKRALEPPDFWDLINPLGPIIDSIERSIDITKQTLDILDDMASAIIEGYRIGLLGFLRWAEAELVRNLPVDSLKFFLLVLMSGEAVPKAGPFAPLGNFVTKWLVSQSPAFNYHLMALAIVLALETSQEPDRSAIKVGALHFLRTVMGTQGAPNPDHSENAFLALVSRHCRGSWFGTLSELSSDLINLLRQVLEWINPSAALILEDPAEWANDDAVDILVDTNIWQHDLPLGPILYVNGVKEENPHLESCKDGIDRDTLLSWNLPMDYNPDDKWGESRTWEHKNEKHVYWRIPPHKIERQRRDPGPDCDYIFARHMEYPGLDIKMEGAGLGLLFPRALAAYWGIHNAPNLQNPHVRWPSLPYMGASPANIRAGRPEILLSASPIMNVHDHHYQKRIRALKKRGAARWAVKKRLFGDTDQDWIWQWWGRHWLVYWSEEAFRGIRRHDYSTKAPLGIVGNIRNAVAEWYIEIASRRSALVEVPDSDWQPANSDLIRNEVLVLRRRPNAPLKEKIQEVDEKLLIALNELPVLYIYFDIMESWDDSRVFRPEMGSSSFFFCRVRIRVLEVFGFRDFSKSVGNENYVITSSILPFWRRFYDLDAIPSDIRYVFNPHSAVIHDLEHEDRSHMQSMAEHGNVLALPIAKNFDVGTKSRQELEYMIAAIMHLGIYDADVAELLPFNPVRKDHYRIPLGHHRADEDPYLPPKRLRQYFKTHPSARTRYEAINTRKVRLCSYCFGR